MDAKQLAEWILADHLDGSAAAPGPQVHLGPADPRSMKAVVLLSGGLDSYTAAAAARRDGYELFALTIQLRPDPRPRDRVGAARRRVARRDSRHIELDVEPGGVRRLVARRRRTRSRRTGAARSTGDREIPSTYVPARNTIFLSLALAWAEVTGSDAIVIGVNALDYSGYPDCRPEYLAAFARLASLATRAGVEGRPFQVLAPLLHLSKADIIRLGGELGPRLRAHTQLLCAVRRRRCLRHLRQLPAPRAADSPKPASSIP